MTRERGNVSVIAVAGIALAMVLCLGLARVGGALLLKARADTAADAAALAAADSLALGRSDSDAYVAARGAAADNDARLLECVCSGGVAEVSVEVVGAAGRARVHARAEVDLSRVPPPVTSDPGA
jgi:Flp pilus assembly protein TadG